MRFTPLPKVNWSRQSCQRSRSLNSPACGIFYRSLTGSTTQRRRAIIFRSGGVVRLGVYSVPNDPVLAAAKGGAVGGGCALMRTLGRFPAAIVTDLDRIRCSVTQILNLATGLLKRCRAGTPSP